MADRRRLVACHYALRRADLVMTDSAALMRRLTELGGADKRTFLVNWGVDLEQFRSPAGDRSSARSAVGLGEGPTILSPRSLSPVYNVPVIIDAFGRIANEMPDVRLVIKHMSVSGRDLGPVSHADRVQLVGHVPYELMPDFYRAADVSVSIASSDSSPRSAWEAMACGSPLVVSDLPWVRELIVHERHALVVPIDAGRVGEAIRRLLVDRDLARELTRNARQLVEIHRDRGREMARLHEAYRDLAAVPAAQL